MRLIPALALPLLALGCASSGSEQRELLASIDEAHDAERERFHVAQQEFARRNPMPMQLDQGPNGTILVHECSLQGFPGHEELWLEYSYVNTTGKTLSRARVDFALTAPGTDDERRRNEVLILPFGFRLGPESCYTTYLRVPTEGLHTIPGWRWTLSAEAVPAPADER